LQLAVERARLTAQVLEIRAGGKLTRHAHPPS
jgi:hypothetical protein